MYVFVFYSFIIEHSNISIPLQQATSEPSTSYERLQMDNERNAAAYQTLGIFMNIFPLFFSFKNDADEVFATWSLFIVKLFAHIIRGILLISYVIRRT